MGLLCMYGKDSLSLSFCETVFVVVWSLERLMCDVMIL